MRRPGAVVPAVALLLALTAVASAGPREAELGGWRPTGRSRSPRTRDGVALLHGERLLPGDSVTGIVTLTNLGDKAGTLALDDRRRARHAPAPSAAASRTCCALRLEDLTAAARRSRPSLTRSAPLGLGTVRGRQTRTYRVTAHLPGLRPPAGPATGDNLLQGSSVELALRWQLTRRRRRRRRPRRRRAGSPPSRRPRPSRRAVTPAPGRRPVRPALVHLRVPAQRVIKPRKLAVYAKCDVKCKVRFSAKIDNAPKPAKKKGKKAKKPKTLMGKRVIKKRSAWFKTKRVGREQRFCLKLTPKALRSGSSASCASRAASASR